MKSNTSENNCVYPGCFMPAMNEECIIETLINAEDDSLCLPMVNVKEFADEYEVQMSAPGLSRENLIVYGDDNLLLVCAPAGEIQNVHNFQRHVNLPLDADTELTIAEYRNSVLHCHVPKTKQLTKHTTARIVVY